MAKIKFNFFLKKRLWCSTQVDLDGNHVIGRDVWGHCETSRGNCQDDIEGTVIGRGGSFLVLTAFYISL